MQVLLNAGVKLLGLWTVLLSSTSSNNVLVDAQATCTPDMINVYFKTELASGLSFNDFYANADSFQNNVATLAAVPVAQVYLEEFETPSRQMDAAVAGNTYIHVRVCTAEQDYVGNPATADAQRDTIVNNINAVTTIGTQFPGYATAPILAVTSAGESHSVHATAATDPNAPVYELSLRLETVSSATLGVTDLDQSRLIFGLIQTLDSLAIPDVFAADIKIGGISEEVVNGITVSEVHFLMLPTTTTGSTQSTDYEAKLNSWTDADRTLRGSEFASAIGRYKDANDVQLVVGTADYDARTNLLNPDFSLMPLHTPGSDDMGDMCDSAMPHVAFEVKIGDSVSFNDYLAMKDDFMNELNAVTALPAGTSFTLASVNAAGAASSDAEVVFHLNFRVCLTNVAPDATDAEITTARNDIKAGVENRVIPSANVPTATEDISVTTVTLVGENIAPPASDTRPFYVGEFYIQDMSVLALDNPVPLTLVKFKILSILADEGVANVLPSDIEMQQPYDTNTAGTTTSNVGRIPFVIYRTESHATQTSDFNDLFLSWDSSKQSGAGNDLATQLGAFNGLGPAEQDLLAPKVLFSADHATLSNAAAEPVVCDRTSPNVYFQVKIGTSNVAVSTFDPVHKTVTAKIAELSGIPLSNFVIDGITTTATSVTGDTSPLTVAYRACLFLPASADATTITNTRSAFKTDIEGIFPMDPDALNLYTFSTEHLTLDAAPTLVGEGVMPPVDSRSHYQAKFVMENTPISSLTSWRLLKLRLSILDTLSSDPALVIPSLTYADIKIHSPGVVPNAYVTISSVYVSIYRVNEDATSAQAVAMDAAIAAWTMDTQRTYGEQFVGVLGFFKDVDGVTDLPATDIEAIKTDTRPVFILGQSGIDAALVAYSNASPSESPSLSTAQGIPDELLAEPVTTVFTVPVAAADAVHFPVAQACAAATSALCVHVSWDGKVAAQSYILESISSHSGFLSAITTPAVAGDPVAAPIINAGNGTTWSFDVSMPAADPVTNIVPDVNPKLDLTMTLSPLGAPAADPKLVVSIKAELLSPTSATSMVSGVSYDGTLSVKYKSVLLNGKELALFLNIGAYGATDGFYPVGVNGPFAALNNDVTN